MKLLNKFNVNCIEATALSVRKEEAAISLIERLKLALHIRICSSCKNFAKQSLLIDQALRNLMNNRDKNPDFLASQDLKNKLKSTFRDQQA